MVKKLWLMIGKSHGMIIKYAICIKLLKNDTFYP